MPRRKKESTVTNNKKNQVVTWNRDLAEQAEAHLDVTLSGTVKSGTLSGTILFLSGPWSAVYDPGTGPVKTDYTDRVTVTVGPYVAFMMRGRPDDCLDGCPLSHSLMGFRGD
jgi:hypothetical protein